MTFAACPRCAERVLLPASASPAATVRCPLCLEEYSLSEALQGLPPQLIVIEDVGGWQKVPMRGRTSHSSSSPTSRSSHLRCL